MDVVQNVEAIGRRGLDREALKRSFLEWLVYSVGKDAGHATRHDWYNSVALAVRDRAVDQWMLTTRNYYGRDQKRVYYLSLEFLIGRLLSNSMANLGITDVCREALAEAGVDIADIVEAEPDAALGNGGLGRLAACFLDSMATLGIAGYGYGIRYDYGMFRQHFDHGWQVERPEDWLRFGNPWEFERPEVAYPIDFYGHVEETRDAEGRRVYRWVNTQRVTAMAYDTPVVGWRGRSINTLRLWSAKPQEEFNLAEFNRGDYMRAVQDKVHSENLSWVLYPADSHLQGQELRFKQEYFFTSASLQDILRRFSQHDSGFDQLPERIAIQLNDTHPAIAVPELMRLLIDGQGLEWEHAWDLTSRAINYTNHTLLPEALEKWPVPLLERILPRHMQIIYEINARFLRSVSRAHPGDVEKLSQVSLIDEAGGRSVRMGNLAFLGSARVNGVSALHTDLMKRTVFRHMNEVFPGRIVNKTNGITPRALARPVQPAARDAGHRDDRRGLGGRPGPARAAAAERDRRRLPRPLRRRKRGPTRWPLPGHLKRMLDLDLDPDAMFDVQIKRIHEYKRQLLNLLHTVCALQRHARRADRPLDRRGSRFFGGKAAPSYHMAKLIIKLGNDIARVVNQDPAVRDLLKIAFVPNYNVTQAERIIPAADLSEQISTAGMEASGTGNIEVRAQTAP